MLTAQSTRTCPERSLMEHDVLLILLTGAGLLALGGLARALPTARLALASSPVRTGAANPLPFRHPARDMTRPLSTPYEDAR